ncbi:hypothetical protein B0H11DRAFT_2291352 [Mycena galericulata]|nr:hypothetical protein B0H11DRAFT_2291352 [Mycena galericulata]
MTAGVTLRVETRIAVGVMLQFRAYAEPHTFRVREFVPRAATENDRELLSARLEQDVMKHSGKMHFFIADTTRAAASPSTTAGVSPPGAHLFTHVLQSSLATLAPNSPTPPHPASLPFQLSELKPAYNYTTGRVMLENACAVHGRPHKPFCDVEPGAETPIEAILFTGAFRPARGEAKLSPRAVRREVMCVYRGNTAPCARLERYDAAVISLAPHRRSWIRSRARRRRRESASGGACAAATRSEKHSVHRYFTPGSRAAVLIINEHQVRENACMHSVQYRIQVRGGPPLAMSHICANCGLRVPPPPLLTEERTGRAAERHGDTKWFCPLAPCAVLLSDRSRAQSQGSASARPTLTLSSLARHHLACFASPLPDAKQRARNRRGSASGVACAAATSSGKEPS